MIIELVKEYDNAGNITYHIKIDDKFQSGSVRSSLQDAMELYERVRANYTQARTEVLIKEEI